MNAIFTTKEHPEYIAALARRGITDLDDVQIDPWPAGVFGYDAKTGRRIARCISFLRTDADRQRLRPADRRPHRPLRHGRQRGDRGHRPRRRPAAAEPRRATTPRTSRALRTRPQADLDHATRGSELHGRRQPRRSGRSGSSASRSIRTRGSCCTRSRTTTTAALRSILHRASISEMVVPYGDPERAARLEERVRRGGVGPRPDDAAAHARLRLPRRDPLLRRDARERAGRAVGDRERDLHARGGLRDPLEARRPVGRARARCGAAGGSSSASSSTVGNYEYGFFWYFYLDGNIQLEVKLTGIVSPMAIEPGAQPGVRERRRPTASPRRTTSTCSTRGSTSTSTAR